jgi:hypothetical protein
MDLSKTRWFVLFIKAVLLSIGPTQCISCTHMNEVCHDALGYGKN